jgi:hypothetical protein
MCLAWPLLRIEVVLFELYHGQVYWMTYFNEAYYEASMKPAYQSSLMMSVVHSTSLQQRVLERAQAACKPSPRLVVLCPLLTKGAVAS